MIYIKKNAINPILLQITSSAPAGEFYFKFINVVNDKVTYFVAMNMSEVICAWDLFELEEDDSLEPNLEFVDNEPCNLISGQYKYYVIVTEDVPTDLEEAIEMDITSNYVAVGKMVVQIINNEFDTPGVVSYNDIPL